MEGMTGHMKGGFANAQFQVRQVRMEQEILNGVVMYKAAKPKNHDFEYTVLVKGKRLNNTSDKSVVMKHRSGDVKILLSVEHGLTRRRDVNDAIRIAAESWHRRGHGTRTKLNHEAPHPAHVRPALSLWSK